MDEMTTMDNDTATPPQGKGPVKKKPGAKRKQYSNRFCRKKGMKKCAVLSQEKNQQSTGLVEVVDLVCTSGTHNTENSRQTRSSSRSNTNNADANNTNTNNTNDNNNNNMVNDADDLTVMVCPRSFTIAVVFVYEQVFRSPHSDEWSGPHGTIQRILVHCRFPRDRNTYRRVLTVLEWLEEKPPGFETATDWIVLTGFDPNSWPGRLPVIRLDDIASVEVVGQCLNVGYSIHSTAQFYNDVCAELGFDPISEAAVWGFIQRAKGKYVAVKQKQQGRLDKESDWAIARTGQCLQLVIRARKTMFETDEEAREWITTHVEQYLARDTTQHINKNKVEAELGNENLHGTYEAQLATNDMYPLTWPPCFQPRYLTPLDFRYAIFVDEKHIQQVVGGVGSQGKK